VSEPVWLTDDELNTWLSFITASQRVYDALDQQLQRDAGIPHSWYAMLALLSSQPGRTARQSAIAAMSDFSLSRLSHAVTRMQERGWVTRETDPVDRRASFVTLTDVGQAALTAAAPGHAAEVRRLFLDKITDEQATALRAASRSILKGLGTMPQGLLLPAGVADCN
jgi:DNA-binding MarR family transcriptional regulator